MTSYQIDDIDRQILYLLQEDARNNSNADISERVGVSPSTVGNRIQQLEANGIIRGYQPNIDYDKADFPLRVLFVCTTSITERANLIQEILDLPGVTNVTELMTGNDNILVEIVGSNNEDITRLATAIDARNISINEEILMKNSYPQPAGIFDVEDYYEDNER